MQKGETIISVALAALVLLAVVSVQRRWNPADLKAVATSAEDFLLSTAGIRGQVPDIAGYERLKTFRLGSYRAGLYRATPAPLYFAPGRVVIYDSSDQPVYRLDTLEGSKESWSAVYDFNGRHGAPSRGNRSRPLYTRDLSGKGFPDVVVGQYSGGDHCCTIATIIELRAGSAAPVGRIGGIDGVPFEGLEIRKLDKQPNWQCIAHRPVMTSCGTHLDAADVLAVYAFHNGTYQDETARFGDFFQDVLRQDLAKWRQERDRNMSLLQTIAVDYAALGEKDAGKRFFALNLTQFMPTLRSHNVDPNACIESLEGVVDREPVAAQPF